MSIIRELIETKIKAWLIKREKNPVGYGSPGTCAFEIEELFRNEAKRFVRLAVTNTIEELNTPGLKLNELEERVIKRCMP